MAFWIASVVGLAIAYLFGSTPTSYLAGKLLKDIDIREHGSRTIGATNVLRTLGRWPAPGGIYVIARHRANIQRLLAGAEPRLGQSSPESKTELNTKT